MNLCVSVFSFLLFSTLLLSLHTAENFSVMLLQCTFVFPLPQCFTPVLSVILLIGEGGGLLDCGAHSIPLLSSLFSVGTFKNAKYRNT